MIINRIGAKHQGIVQITKNILQLFWVLLFVFSVDFIYPWYWYIPVGTKINSVADLKQIIKTLYLNHKNTQAFFCIQGTVYTSTVEFFLWNSFIWRQVCNMKVTKSQEKTTRIYKIWITLCCIWKSRSFSLISECYLILLIGWVMCYCLGERFSD